MRVISANIYKWNLGDCSNNGISSRYHEVLIPCEDGWQEIDENNPPENFCIMEKREFRDHTFVHLVPYHLANSGKWTMMGGTFAYSSDSRFIDCTDGFGWQPIAIHDRVED